MDTPLTMHTQPQTPMQNRVDEDATALARVRYERS